MYFQYPTHHENNTVFVQGDRLWIMRGQCAPTPLTDHATNTITPKYSPCGNYVAYAAHNDLFVISTQTGAYPRQLTHVQSPMRVVGWHEEYIIISCGMQHPFGLEELYKIHSHTAWMQKIPLGPCSFISMAPDQKKSVIQRHGYGYTAWKGYQGGAAGELWIDREGDNNYVRLLSHIKHNMLCPFWVENRIYFLCDKDGVGGIYSCDVNGEDFQKNVAHKRMYARHLSYDGTNFFYSAGGDLYKWSPHDQENPTRINVPFSMNAMEHAFVRKNAQKNCTFFAASSEGKFLALITRGRLFQAVPHKGPVMQKGQRDGVRYTNMAWLANGNLVVVCHKGEETVWEQYTNDSNVLFSQYITNLGHVLDIKSHPHRSMVACVNHQHNLYVVCLETEKTIVVDHSPKGQFKGFSWSPCGEWIVYAQATTTRTAGLWVYHVSSGEKHLIMSDAFNNSCPVFDPKGRYIYFLSQRHFTPQWDEIHTNLGCDRTTKIYAVCLQRDTQPPFVLPLMGSFHKEKNEAENNDMKTTDPSTNSCEQDVSKTSPKTISPTEISFKDIARRVVELPLKENDYHQVIATSKGLFYTVMSDGLLSLHMYDHATFKEEKLIPEMDNFDVTADHTWILYSTQKKLRMVALGQKPDDSCDTSIHNGGWFDWNRIVLNVHAQTEWKLMFEEAWQLQKNLFWTEKMGKVDWDEVKTLYEPQVNRISCASELRSILQDMQGELRTSHAYVMDQSSKMPKTRASLGVDFTYDIKENVYRVGNVIDGQQWKGKGLLRCDIGIETGHIVRSIAGYVLDAYITPEYALQGTADQVIFVEILHPVTQISTLHSVIPFSISEEKSYRYKQWVERNRSYVHATSEGTLGYIHIPDMDKKGYAEFLEGYLQEYDRQGLVIDARFNGGGNISYLIMDWLKRQRLGYDKSRHHGLFPYPSDAPWGPMILLTNAHTGSDGDIFSHTFKMLGMGSVVGKRTWGGVVGISPRYSLLDGTMTTQPEFAFWFNDVGWSIENQGVSPDVDIDITPQDYGLHKDTQLTYAVRVLHEEVRNVSEAQKAMKTPPPEPVLAITE